MSEPQIMVIEDEPSIREVVVLYLQRAGFRTLEFSDGLAALEALENEEPALIVLDVMLPHVDGFEITRKLRARGDTPIIMLTARRGELDRITGLELGADDYVVKPFSPQELVSRVRAVLRRTYGSGSTEEEPLVLGELSIDPTTREVRMGEAEKKLTAKEFDLLWFLASNPRRVFSRDQLLDLVWGRAEYIDPSTVTVHVRRLREKIESDASQPNHLLTVWGVGYKYEP